jgi:hypothetical protein
VWSRLFLELIEIELGSEFELWQQEPEVVSKPASSRGNNKFLSEF